MQLSEQEVQYLFEFTRKKFVYWYDLQIELVDHLASRIEEEMEANTTLSFGLALDRVYKSFGIFGFAKIVQEKSEQLQRASRKMWWGEIRTLFSWPKVMMLAMISAALWQLSQWFDPNILMIIFLIAYVATSIILIRYTRRTGKMRHKLMLLQVGPVHFSSSVFIYETVIIYGRFSMTAIEFCILATIGILIKIASFQLYIKVKEKAREQYPEAFA